jgi:polyisoprenoid-binding protein YceI
MAVDSTTTTPAQTLTTWSIDPAHSSIEFAVRHLMISTVKGRFTEVTGSVTSDDAELSSGRVDISIGVASIDTREAQRDAHLRSADFFDAENFPALTFRSTRVEGSGDSFKLIGDLSIRGVSRQVVLDVTSEGRGKDPWGGERAGFSGNTKIKRSDFGLTWNQLLETGGVAVSDDVRISIDVELVKQAAQ